MMGTLSILNVYEGDVKISYDTTNAAEAIRAKRIISDMLRRGYALLIEVDGAYQRAVDFDPAVGEYIIADFDPSYRVKPTEESKVEDDDDDEDQAKEKSEAKEAPTIKRGRPRRRLPMETVNAVAIARSAGG